MATMAIWILAAGTSSAIQGALSMLFFAFGTVPCMYLFGVFGTFLPRCWSKG